MKQRTTETKYIIDVDQLISNTGKPETAWSKTLAQLLSVNSFQVEGRKDAKMGISFIQNDKIGKCSDKFIIQQKKWINQTRMLSRSKTWSTETKGTVQRNDRGQFNVFFIFSLASGWKDSNLIKADPFNFWIQFPRSRR
jgi:hypothetical protein